MLSKQQRMKDCKVGRRGEETITDNRAGSLRKMLNYPSFYLTFVTDNRPASAKLLTLPTPVIITKVLARSNMERPEMEIPP